MQPARDASQRKANDVLRMLTLSQRAARKKYKRQRNKQLKEWTRKRQVRGTKAAQPVTYRIPTEVSARKEYTETLKGVILFVAIKRVARSQSVKLV